MPARAGNWDLLDRSSDPIVADTGVMEELVTYYKTIADEITSEADVLRRIGAGDETHFKGETANAVRAKSKEVAESLQKMSGRYTAIRDALTGYLPTLEGSLTESMAALHDAEDAAAAGSQAAAMADPSQNRAQDAPPLTSDEQGAVDAKHRATTAASDAAGAAKARLQRTLDTLDGAGRAAADTIRAAWDDGLHDTGWDKFKAFFAAILKILVKILTYIGIALAALAILIPGVGILTFMAAVTAAVTLVANITLAGMGEGSWLDVITSAVGLVLVGMGGALTKIASTAKTIGLSKGMVGFQKNTMASISKLQGDRTAAIAKAFNPRNSPTAFRSNLDEVKAITAKINDVRKTFSESSALNTIGKFKEKPNWWRPNAALLKEDKSKFMDVYGGLFGKEGGKGYQWQRLFSVDRQFEMDDMAKVMWKDFGVAIDALPAWHKIAAGGRVVGSWANTIVYGQGLKPTGFGSDQERLPGYKDATGALTTA